MELLGIPEHFLWLRDLADESTADRLETTALACLEGPADLAARAAGLAQQSRQAIGALLELAA
jgi:hypothetical protein